jgi:putative transposase
LWRAVDQDGFVLDVLVQGRRDRKAAKRLLRKLPKKSAMAPRVMVTDKLGSYGAARSDMGCVSACNVDPVMECALRSGQ